MGDIAFLRFPKKSHRKKITIPYESDLLAEFLGIIAGDGSINNNCQVVVTLKSEVDRAYSRYIAFLVEKLFNIQSSFIERVNYHVINVVTSSTALVDYIVEKGGVRGHKIKGLLDMPAWVKTNKGYQKAFSRGLFDTDGCTYIDMHKYKGKVYKHLGVAFSSYSSKLLESIFNSLVIAGLSPTRTTQNRILLRKEKEVLRFFNEYSPVCRRHLDKLNLFLEEYRSGHNGAVSKAAFAVR